MQAKHVIGEVAGATGALGGGVDAEHPFQQGVDDLGAAVHSRGFQHELGQYPGDVGVKRPLLVGNQVADNILGFDTDG